MYGPVQDVLQDINRVCVTLMPEPYRHWEKEVKTHVATHPHFVAVNKRGQLLWTDMLKNRVLMCNTYNPVKVKSSMQ